MIEAIKSGAYLVFDIISTFISRLTAPSTYAGINGLLPVFGLLIAMMVVSFAVGLVKRICSN